MTRNPGRGYLVRRLSAMRVPLLRRGAGSRQQRANSDVTFFIRALHSPLRTPRTPLATPRVRGIHHRHRRIHFRAVFFFFFFFSLERKKVENSKHACSLFVAIVSNRSPENRNN